MATQAAKGANEKFCFECGSAINARAEICPRCGVRQHAPPSFIGGSTASGKNRIAAALFAPLLGGIGIHKFYLGFVGQGILYLLFCWTFIPAIIGLIEGIVYLTMSDASFEEKYVNIPTETTRPDTGFPLVKHETVMSPQFKTIIMAVGAFLLAFALFKGR
jgi:TM2 domain-containing membrane protein YozV